MSLFRAGDPAIVVAQLRHANALVLRTVAGTDTSSVAGRVKKNGGSLMVHPWALGTEANLVHWKNKTEVDARFGESAFAEVLRTVEQNRTDDKNLEVMRLDLGA